MFDSRSARFRSATVDKLFKHTCLRHQAVYLVAGVSWEGNRRSGIAPAMRHRQIYSYEFTAVERGDRHPANAPPRVWFSLPYYTLPLG